MGKKGIGEYVGQLRLTHMRLKTLKTQINHLNSDLKILNKFTSLK